jgi:phospholipid/cholesterol/gamma-HCH transport system permease protein
MAGIDNASAAPNAWFKLDQGVLSMGGLWTIRESARLDKDLRAFRPEGTGAIAIDASKIERLDSTGAWLLLRTRRALESGGRQVSDLTVPELYRPLLDDIARGKGVPVERPHRNSVRERLERIGRATVHAGQQGYRMLGYLGRVTVETIDAIASPKSNLRVAALIH